MDNNTTKDLSKYFGQVFSEQIMAMTEDNEKKAFDYGVNLAHKLAKKDRAFGRGASKKSEADLVDAGINLAHKLGKRDRAITKKTMIVKKPKS